MTQQSTTTAAPAAAPAAPPAAPEASTTIDQRRAALLAAPDEAPANDAAPAAAKDGLKPVAPAAPADETDPVKRAEARRARLAEINAGERRKVDAKTKLAEHDQLRALARQALARAEEAERRAAKLLDPAKLDEAAFFALAEQANITPDKLAEFVKASIANPGRIAAAAAVKQVDPQLSELKARLAESEARLQRFFEAQEQAQQASQESAHEAEFVSFAKGASSTAPHTARFAEKFGDQEFLKVARAAAQQLRPGAGPQALLDTIEEQLEQLSAMYAPAEPATPSKTTTKAPAKPTTVSNTNAQERASVVEDDEWSSLSLEERAARLRR